MATKRFRQKRNTNRFKRKQNTKRKRGGLVGQQNDAKSYEDNEKDFKKWNALNPIKYKTFDPSMYYYSFNIFNRDREPEEILDRIIRTPGRERRLRTKAEIADAYARMTPRDRKNAGYLM